MEQSIERAKAWLEDLLKLMGFSTKVKIDKKAANEMTAGVWLIIDETPFTPEQIQNLLGDRGQGLDAIQYLANTLMNLGLESDQQHTFIVELAGYRLQRQAELLAIAQEATQRVKTSGFPVEIASLSSAERRQIHAFIQNDPDLETESQGQEPDRRLVIRLRVPQASFLIAKD